jgi:two-component system sensor histidine kinase PilS (NtrC family)
VSWPGAWRAKSLPARGSLELARQQAQLNRLVIEEMADGVLVVDRRCRVRAANPAARAAGPPGRWPAGPLLAVDGRAAAPAADARALALAQALARSRPRRAAGPSPAATPHPAVRVRFMRGAASLARQRTRDRAKARPSACCCWKTCARAGARRQEKLAAMGRVSAGIAHEIRNPLAAIAQANALLLEDDLPPRSAAGHHGGRQRRAAQAHRRRRDGGGPGRRRR